MIDVKDVKNDRYLTEGEFVFKTKNCREVFKIEGIAGIGGSFIAYKVRHRQVDLNTNEVFKESPHVEILKEYCPDFFVEKGGFKRTGMEIKVPENLPDDLKKRFAFEKDDIEKMFYRVNDTLNEEDYNFHSKQYGIYKGYGTVYIHTEYTTGKVLSDATELDLPTLLQMMKYAAIAVDRYHKKGFLHLDIKPQNFFLVKGTGGGAVDLKQFDYNSIISMEEMQKAIMDGQPERIRLFGPGVYFVRELASGNLKEIGVKTDIYEIGAMLYLCLFKDTEYFHGFEKKDVIDLSSSKLLRGVDDGLMDELEEFLRKTASVSDGKRYDKMSQVIDHLQRIIEAEEKTRVYREFDEIHKNLTLVPDDGVPEDMFASATGVSDIQMYILINSGRAKKWDNGNISPIPEYAEVTLKNNDIPKRKSYYDLADELEESCILKEDDRVNGSKAKMICRAVHLKNCYEDESAERRIRIRIILAQLYISVCDFSSALDNIKEAEDIAEITKRSKVKTLLLQIIITKGDYENGIGNYCGALEYYEEAELMAKHPEYGSKETVIEAKMKKAHCHLKNGDPHSACIVYDGARYYSQRNDLSPSYTVKIAKAVLGICNENGYTDKIETYENILKLANEELGETETTADAAGMAERMFTAGEYFPHMAEYETYLKTAGEELGEDSDEYKHASEYQWVCCILNGEYEKGKDLCGKTLRFIKQTYGEGSAQLAKHYIAIARLYPRMSEFAYAESCAKAAIEICRKNGKVNSVLYFRAHLELAGCYFRMGDLYEADRALSKISLSKYDGINMLTEQLFAVGSGLCELGYCEAAEELCNKIKRLEGTDPSVTVYADLTCAVAKVYRGYYGDAKKICLESVLPFVESMADCPSKKEWMIKCHRILASLQFRAGNYSDAVKMIGEQIGICRGDEPYLAHLYRERGVYYAASRKHLEAADDFKKCGDLLKKNIFSIDCSVMLYNSRVYDRIIARDFTAANEYLKEICNIKPSVTEPVTYSDSMICNNMGIVAFECGKVGLAGKMFSVAYLNFERMGATLTEDCISSLLNLVPAYESKGYSDTARDTYHTVTVLREKARTHAQS